jgi:hypothetical protein
MHQQSVVATRDVDTSPWVEIVKPAILLGDRWQAYLAVCPPWETVADASEQHCEDVSVTSSE